MTVRRRKDFSRLNDAIIAMHGVEDEAKACRDYLERAKDADDPKLRDTLIDVVKEEAVHLGEFEQRADEATGYISDKIKEGRKEAVSETKSIRSRIIFDGTAPIIKNDDDDHKTKEQIDRDNASAINTENEDKSLERFGVKYANEDELADAMDDDLKTYDERTYNIIFNIEKPKSNEEYAKALKFYSGWHNGGWDHYRESLEHGKKPQVTEEFQSDDDKLSSWRYFRDDNLDKSLIPVFDTFAKHIKNNIRKNRKDLKSAIDAHDEWNLNDFYGLDENIIQKFLEDPKSYTSFSFSDIGLPPELQDEWNKTIQTYRDEHKNRWLGRHYTDDEVFDMLIHGDHGDGQRGPIDLEGKTPKEIYESLDSKAFQQGDEGDSGITEEGQLLLDKFNPMNNLSKQHQILKTIMDIARGTRGFSDLSPEAQINYIRGMYRGFVPEKDVTGITNIGRYYPYLRKYRPMDTRFGKENIRGFGPGYVASFDAKDDLHGNPTGKDFGTAVNSMNAAQGMGDEIVETGNYKKAMEDDINRKNFTAHVEDDIAHYYTNDNDTLSRLVPRALYRGGYFAIPAYAGGIPGEFVNRTLGEEAPLIQRYGTYAPSMPFAGSLIAMMNDLSNRGWTFDFTPNGALGDSDGTVKDEDKKDLPMMSLPELFRKELTEMIAKKELDPKAFKNLNVSKYINDFIKGKTPRGISRSGRAYDPVVQAMEGSRALKYLYQLRDAANPKYVNTENVRGYIDDILKKALADETLPDSVKQQLEGKIINPYSLADIYRKYVVDPRNESIRDEVMDMLNFGEGIPNGLTEEQEKRYIESNKKHELRIKSLRDILSKHGVTFDEDGSILVPKYNYDKKEYEGFEKLDLPRGRLEKANGDVIDTALDPDGVGYDLTKIPYSEYSQNGMRLNTKTLKLLTQMYLQSRIPRRQGFVSPLMRGYNGPLYKFMLEGGLDKLIKEYSNADAHAPLTNYNNDAIKSALRTVVSGLLDAVRQGKYIGPSNYKDKVQAGVDIVRERLGHDDEDYDDIYNQFMNILSQSDGFDNFIMNKGDMSYLYRESSMDPENLARVNVLNKIGKAYYTLVTGEFDEETQTKVDTARGAVDFDNPNSLVSKVDSAFRTFYNSMEQGDESKAQADEVIVRNSLVDLFNAVSAMFTSGSDKDILIALMKDLDAGIDEYKNSGDATAFMSSLNSISPLVAEITKAGIMNETEKGDTLFRGKKELSPEEARQRKAVLTMYGRYGHMLDDKEPGQSSLRERLNEIKMENIGGRPMITSDQEINKIGNILLRLLDNKRKGKGYGLTSETESEKFTDDRQLLLELLSRAPYGSRYDFINGLYSMDDDADERVGVPMTDEAAAAADAEEEESYKKAGLPDFYHSSRTVNDLSNIMSSISDLRDRGKVGKVRWGDLDDKKLWLNKLLARSFSRRYLMDTEDKDPGAWQRKQSAPDEDQVRERLVFLSSMFESPSRPDNGPYQHRPIEKFEDYPPKDQELMIEVGAVIKDPVTGARYPASSPQIALYYQEKINERLGIPADTKMDITNSEPEYDLKMSSVFDGGKNLLSHDVERDYVDGNFKKDINVTTPIADKLSGRTDNDNETEAIGYEAVPVEREQTTEFAKPRQRKDFKPYKPEPFIDNINERTHNGRMYLRSAEEKARDELRTDVPSGPVPIGDAFKVNPLLNENEEAYGKIVQLNNYLAGDDPSRYTGVGSILSEDDIKNSKESIKTAQGNIDASMKFIEDMNELDIRYGYTSRTDDKDKEPKIPGEILDAFISAMTDPKFSGFSREIKEVPMYKKVINDLTRLAASNELRTDKNEKVKDGGKKKGLIDKKNIIHAEDITPLDILSAIKLLTKASVPINARSLSSTARAISDESTFKQFDGSYKPYITPEGQYLTKLREMAAPKPEPKKIPTLFSDIDFSTLTPEEEAKIEQDARSDEVFDRLPKKIQEASLNKKKAAALKYKNKYGQEDMIKAHLEKKAVRGRIYDFLASKLPTFETLDTEIQDKMIDDLKEVHEHPVKIDEHFDIDMDSVLDEAGLDLSRVSDKYREKYTRLFESALRNKIDIAREKNDMRVVGKTSLDQLDDNVRADLIRRARKLANTWFSKEEHRDHVIDVQKDLDREKEWDRKEKHKKEEKWARRRKIYDKSKEKKTEEKGTSGSPADKVDREVYIDNNELKTEMKRHKGVFSDNPTDAEVRRTKQALKNLLSVKGYKSLSAVRDPIRRQRYVDMAIEAARQRKGKGRYAVKEDWRNKEEKKPLF